MITKPMLSPKPGYVEVEINGVRRYRNVITGVLLEDEIRVEPITEPTTEEILNALLGVSE